MRTENQIDMVDFTGHIASIKHTYESRNKISSLSFE